MYIQICFINNFSWDAVGKTANWKMSLDGKTLNTTLIIYLLLNLKLNTFLKIKTSDE